MVEMKKMQRIAGLVNTIVLGCMILGLLSFQAYGVTYMVYHCIPSIVVLVVFYFFIYKQRLALFVAFIYADLAVYMAAATICLGYNSGFHLYCMSLIPLAFYMEYMANKLQVKKMRALPASIVLVVINLACTGYVVMQGPVYNTEATIALRFMYVNAIIVFCFLIGYGNLMRKLITASEDQLTDMAHTDRLTGLFNRHYMMNHLDALYQAILPGQWIAMADIDDFKKINDTYGHNCGDYVLMELAKIMQDVCQNSTISRWGGEEFLIIGDSESSRPEILETLRQRVEHTSFTHQGKDIPVTITIGVSYYQEGQSLSSWIWNADTKLYDGKNCGKNCVIF